MNYMSDFGCEPNQDGNKFRACQIKFSGHLIGGRKVVILIIFNWLIRTLRFKFGLLGHQMVMRPLLILIVVKRLRILQMVGLVIIIAAVPPMPNAFQQAEIPRNVRVCTFIQMGVIFVLTITKYLMEVCRPPQAILQMGNGTNMIIGLN